MFITILFVVNKKDERAFLPLFFVVIIQIAFPEFEIPSINSGIFVLQMERKQIL